MKRRKKKKRLREKRKKKPETTWRTRAPILLPLFRPLSRACFEILLQGFEAEKKLSSAWSVSD